MKKFLLLLLSLVLLLSSCSGVRKFERDAEGYGYTDTKTDLYYAELDSAFEPAEAGEVWGEYTNKKTDVTRVFRVIPNLDPTLFLTDEYLSVYYAGDEKIDAAKWATSEILVCKEDVISVVDLRFTAKDQPQTVSEICSLWFEDTGDAVIPLGKADYVRRIKLRCDQYPNLLYCFSFLAYDSGEAYFYDASSRRTVTVPDALAAQLRRPAATEG